MDLASSLWFRCNRSKRLAGAFTSYIMTRAGQIYSRVPEITCAIHTGDLLYLALLDHDLRFHSIAAVPQEAVFFFYSRSLLSW